MADHIVQSAARPLAEGELPKDLADFLLGYLTSAVWTGTDNEGEPIDRKFTHAHFAEGEAKRAQADCEKFMAENKADLLRFVKYSHSWQIAGIDFWLTRNGHGAGYWDRGLGEVGERLTTAARAMGEIMVLADNDKLYFE